MRRRFLGSLVPECDPFAEREDLRQVLAQPIQSSPHHFVRFRSVLRDAQIPWVFSLRNQAVRSQSKEGTTSAHRHGGSSSSAESSSRISRGRRRSSRTHTCSRGW